MTTKEKSLEEVIEICDEKVKLANIIFKRTDISNEEKIRLISELQKDINELNH